MCKSGANLRLLVNMILLTVRSVTRSYSPKSRLITPPAHHMALMVILSRARFMATSKLWLLCLRN